MFNKLLVAASLCLASNFAHAEPGVSSVAVVVLHAEIFTVTGDDSFMRLDGTKVAFAAKGSSDVVKATSNGVAYWNYGSTSEPFDAICVKLAPKASLCASVKRDSKGKIALGAASWKSDSGALPAKLPTCSLASAKGYAGITNDQNFDSVNVVVAACHTVL